MRGSRWTVRYARSATVTAPCVARRRAPRSGLPDRRVFPPFVGSPGTTRSCGTNPLRVANAVSAHVAARRWPCEIAHFRRRSRFRLPHLIRILLGALSRINSWGQRHPGSTSLTAYPRTKKLLLLEPISIGPPPDFNTGRSNRSVVPFWRRTPCPPAGGQRCWAQLNRISVSQPDD